MVEIIFVVEQPPEGGFVARALGESIVTQADSVPELHARVRDAVHCHFDEGSAPKMIRLHFVRDEVIPPRDRTIRTGPSPVQGLTVSR